MPDISRGLGVADLGDVRATLRRATWLKFGLVGVGAAGLGLFGHSILGAFGQDDRYVDGYAAMSILATALVFRSAGGPGFQILSVSGHHAHAVRVAAAGLTTTVGLHMILVPTHGLTGAAVTILVATILTTCWMRVLCIRKVGVDPSLWIRHGRDPE